MQKCIIGKKMIRKTNLENEVDREIKEIKTVRNKPISYNVIYEGDKSKIQKIDQGDRVSVKSGTVIDLQGRYEFVESNTSNQLHVFYYRDDGKIGETKYRLYDFKLTDQFQTSYERQIIPGTPEYRSISKVLKENANIRLVLD